MDVLIEAAYHDPELVVGLDFAFSLPERFMRDQGLESAEHLWRAPRRLIEGWLREVPPPFYGKGGRKLDPDWADDLLRRTDRGRGSAWPFLLAGPKQEGPGRCAASVIWLASRTRASRSGPSNRRRFRL
ncbi:MAG: hypothetical protein OER93_03515, partial [Thermoleophilia bacterium]|nr:hypothetical protein [Thermoleophilia bacterium]